MYSSTLQDSYWTELVVGLFRQHRFVFQMIILSSKSLLFTLWSTNRSINRYLIRTQLFGLCSAGLKLRHRRRSDSHTK